MGITRCAWVGNDPLYLQYHDQVWGRAVYEPLQLFAKLCLEGQQAGLSWLTILRKQASYEAAFAQFDPIIIATFDEAKIEQLMNNAGIVRHRLKINSIIDNAKSYLAYTEQGGNFSEFLWQFVGGRPMINRFTFGDSLPTQTPQSVAMSKALKKLGFSFVGPRICYAFMQAVGMVNDHLIDCIYYHDCLNSGHCE